MSKGTLGCGCAKKHALRISLGVALLLVTVIVLGACGDGSSDDSSLPPATIIRASDATTPTGTSASEATLTPSSSPKAVPTARDKDYPIPASKPQVSATPAAYPTK